MRGGNELLTFIPPLLLVIVVLSQAITASNSSINVKHVFSTLLLVEKTC